MIVIRMAWSFWRIPVRLAWRDLRGSRLRAAFIVCAMAISIATVAGVYGAAAVARKSLGRDSRVWLAGDLAVDTTEPISDDQIAALNQIRREGIDWTIVTSTLTVGASHQSPDPVLIEVKAVDPAVYPFYGAATLGAAGDPPGTLAAALGPDRVVVSNHTLERLHVKVGDRITIAAKPFFISAVIAAEPERFSGVFNWGPKCMLSRTAFQRIAASAAGNTVTNRILLRLPPRSITKDLRRRLQGLVPEGRVFDYREAAAPEVARIELVISFVSIEAFLALALGAVGVATAVRLNLEQRIEWLAILRITGAQSSQMASLFLVETAAMLGGGLALGLPLGWVVKGSLMSLAARYLVLPHSAFWDGGAILPSALAAAAITAPVLAGPADALRRLSPLAVLRRDVSETRPFDWRTVWMFAAAVAIALVAAGGIAYGMIQAWKPALFLVAALTASAGIAWAISAGAVRSVRSSIHRWRRAPILKHALVGLCRSGNRSLIPLVCVALGAMTITASFQSSAAVIQAVSAALPYSGANLLVVDFEDSYREQVRAFLVQQPGVEKVEMLTQTWLRIARVNGVAIEDSRYLGRCTSDPMPGAGTILADDLAGRIGAHVGSDLEFETREGILRTAVSAIRHPLPQERFWFTFLVECRGLPQSSLIQAAAVSVRPIAINSVRNAINRRFPTLGTITAQEIESTIRGVTDDAMILVRLITWSAAVGGLLILIAVVATSRTARSREIAILIALGAQRRVIFKIYSLEFAALGILAGLIGNVLGCGLNSVILTALFHHIEVAFSWRAAAASILASPLLVWCAGWLPTFRLLREKPLAILRRE